MAVPLGRTFRLTRVWSRARCLLVASAVLALPCFSDEIRLKDGKKLYGVIVAYEENMFKVKTDFGYVLVEKDKIASIIPTTPQGPGPEADAKGDPKQPPKTGSGADAKPSANLEAKNETGAATGADAKPAVTNTSAKTPIGPTKRDSGAGKATNLSAKPDAANAQVNGNTATPSKAGAAAASAAGSPTASANIGARTQPAGSTPAGPAAAAPPAIQGPPPAKPPEPPREEVQGNLYINRVEGFRMFKAPSWQLIEGAQNALPNAVVAMGTPEQSTLMVVGREKTKEPLDAAANGVERRLHDVYENYRLISTKKATVAGAPAMEFHFAGKADEHDWSGTLVVISRGTDIFTVLGMTYADSDLIQIQENVIARAVASLSFDVK